MSPSKYSRERSQQDLKRKRSKSAGYDRLLIVCEGKKTEPLYFTEIRQFYRLRSTNVQIYHSEIGTCPVQVVQYAQDLFETGNAHLGILCHAFEKVYAVFDRDEHLKYHKALKAAEKLNGKMRNDEKQPVIFKAIPSVPNFELWLLLHFREVLDPIHRHDVLSTLKIDLPGYEKGQDGHFKQTMDRLPQAFNRADRLRALYTAYDDNPYTDIDELVKILTTLTHKK